MEISLLVCRTNQWTSFYMIRTSVMKELNIFVKSSIQGLHNFFNKYCIIALKIRLWFHHGIRGRDKQVVKKVYYRRISRSEIREECITTLIQMNARLTLAKVKFSPCKLSLTSDSSPPSAWLGKPFSWLIPSRTFLIPWNFFISYFDPFSFFILLHITPATSNNKMYTFSYEG